MRLRGGGRGADDGGVSVSDAPSSRESESVSSSRESEVDEIPARDVLARISDRWTLAVMRVLQRQGPLHFGRLERQLPGVSRKMLTQTLRSIERDGMVSRTVHPGRVTHVEYALTALGRGALEPIDVLCAWSRDNMAVVESARARYDAAAHLDG